LSTSSDTVRVRFAPSPTGYLHVGGARTAFYNYLFARQQGGKFIIRVEDTDEARSSEDSLRGMIDDLIWLDLKWDEGPNPETLKDMGPYPPYRQSQRQSIYQKAAQEILQKGQAYYCFMTDAEIDEQRQKALAAGLNPHIDSPYQDWPVEKALAEIKVGKKAVIRFKTRHLKKDYILKDLIRGEVKFPSDMVGDFVLLRSDGMPVYNFCCVIDDHMMKMTHILRAEEHLPNTLRQMMIYEAMGWSLPQFGHVSLILDEERQKLSKRKGAVSCGQFRDEGYLKEALLNFLVLLGWTHPQEKEVLTMDEMIKEFAVDRLHTAGAVFDRVKLRWMNAQHLRAKSSAELWKLTEPFLKKAGLHLPTDPQWQEQSIEVFKTSMETLVDAIELYKPLDDTGYVIYPESDETLKWEPTKSVLLAWIELLKSHPREAMTGDEFLKMQDEVKNKTGAKGKNLFMPIRVAVIGKPHGTELKILVPLMKKHSLIARAEKALAKAEGV
jgi:glutamyl-tRNA synthetase